MFVGFLSLVLYLIVDIVWNCCDVQSRCDQRGGLKCAATSSDYDNSSVCVLFVFISFAEGAIERF